MEDAEVQQKAAGGAAVPVKRVNLLAALTQVSASSNIASPRLGELFTYAPTPVCIYITLKQWVLNI